MKKSEIFLTILKVVSSCMELSIDDILTGKRNEDIVIARCLITIYGKNYNLSNKNLQDFLNLKSHTSICYYTQMYAERNQNDRYFRNTSMFVGQELVKTMSATRL